VIDADSAWKIDCQGNLTHFVNMSRPNGENVASTSHNWPVPGGREQVHLMVRRITKLIPFAGKEDYSWENIIGNDFSSDAAIFDNWDLTFL
jgi:hypothetical protein